MRQELPGPRGPALFLEVERLPFLPGIEVADEFGVAVEQVCLDLLARGDVALLLLAPARMRHVRIDVRPEAVGARRDLLVEAERPLIREGEPDDRFHRLEAVFPWQMNADRCAHGLRKRLAICPG